MARQKRMGTPWLGGVRVEGLPTRDKFVSSAHAVSSTTSTFTQGNEMIVRMAIGTGATQTSVTVIPANAVVVKTTVTVVTPYSGGATIDVGYSGSLSALSASASNDNIPTAAGDYNNAAPVVWAGTPQAVVVTVGGSPGAGAGFVLVEWANPSA